MVNEILSKKGNDTLEQREGESQKHGGETTLPSRAQKTLVLYDEEKKRQKNAVLPYVCSYDSVST